MSAPVKVLHVEDDEVSALVIARHLRALPEFEFVVVRAATEPEAWRAFNGGDVGLVLLDYHLEQGDGLSLLKRLRAADTLVPIVALSGVATTEIAADLLAAGADDYLAKRDFSPPAFAAAVREALTRAEQVRRRGRLDSVEGRQRFDERFKALCQEFAACVGDRFLLRLERLEVEARQAKLTRREFRSMMDSSGWRLDPLAIRPILLEVEHRLFGADRPEPGQNSRREA